MTTEAISYSARELAIVNNLKVAIPQMTKSVIIAGHHLFDLQVEVRKTEGRFDLICESLGITRDRAYYCIKVYRNSLPKVELPAAVREYMERNGLNLTMPANPTAEQQKEITANEKAVQRAFQKEGAIGEPNRKQLANILTQSINYLDVDEPSEQNQILDSFNAIFTDSYVREVGTPKFGKKEKGKKDRPFLGYFPVGSDKTKDENLVEIAEGQFTENEKKWVKMMEQTLRSITGKSGMGTWLTGGPDLGCLGRGTDRFTIQDLQLKEVA